MCVMSSVFRGTSLHCLEPDPQVSIMRARHTYQKEIRATKHAQTKHTDKASERTMISGSVKVIQIMGETKQGIGNGGSPGSVFWRLGQLEAWQSHVVYAYLWDISIKSSSKPDTRVPHKLVCHPN